ncbi:hypothetical protein D3C77_572770 [compost metagenome]
MAPSHESYLTQQISRIPSSTNSEELSEQINHALNFASRIFGYAIPKALALLEDIVNLELEARGTDFRASYGHLRSIFENYHLHPAWAGLEEMGIPVQLLHKLGARFPFGEEASVDDASRTLRENLHQLKGLSPLERHFIDRALGRVKRDRPT